MSRFFSSLRFRLMLLVLLAAVPALAVIVYAGAQERQRAAQQAESQALGTAKITAADFESMTAGASQFLSALSQLPEVKSLNGPASSALFASLLAANARYANIGAITPDGNVFASAVSPGQQFNFSDKAWFQEALKSSDYVVGNYMVGPIIGRDTIHIAQSFRDGNGAVEEVLFVALDLNWLAERVSAAELPAGSTLMLIDSIGVVVAGYPESAGLVGRSISTNPLVRIILADKSEGTVDAIGLDGKARLFGFVPLTTTGNGPYLSVGILRSTAYAAANHALERNLLYLLAAALVALATTGVVTSRLVLRPVNRIVSATRRLAQGDLAARTGVAGDKSELGELAHAIDEMSNRLQQRQAEAGQSLALLQKSDERYRGLYDSIQDGILMTDIPGRILDCNQKFADMLGYTKEELLLLTNQTITPEKWRRRDGGQLRYQVFVKGYSEEYEKEYTTKDGRNIPIAAKVWLVKDEQGNPKSLWGIMRDITERKKAENELKTALRFLQIANQRSEIGPLLESFVGEIKSLSGCSAVGIRLRDKDGNIPYSAYTGFSRAFYESESPLSLHTDQCMCIRVIEGTTDPKLSFYTEYGSFYQNGTTSFLKTVSESEKGETRNVCNAAGYESVALIPIRLGNEILGLIHVADPREDRVPLHLVRQLEQVSAALAISIKRASAEQELRETGAYLDNLLRYANAPIIVWDAGFRITRFNHAFERLTGLSAGQAIGKQLDILFPFDKREESMALIRRTLTGERWEVVEIPILHQDGTVSTVLWNSATLFAADSKTPVATIAQGQDITRRKAAEEDIRRLNEELSKNIRYLEAANKELEAFSYSVSHDLRAPLRAIDGFSGILLEEYSSRLDEEGKRYLGIIAGNARKMGDLINDLLSFSRLSRQALKVSVVDMEKLAGEVCEDCRQREPDSKARELKCEIGPLPAARGDAAMLRQVLVNLVANAVKFTRPRERALIGIGARVDGREKAYFVRDNGVGFDMQYYGKLFGVFQRLHREEEFEGTGVGLAIVQRIVHRHGGRVWAESELNKGATFYFTLPD